MAHVEKRENGNLLKRRAIRSSLIVRNRKLESTGETAGVFGREEAAEGGLGLAARFVGC